MNAPADIVTGFCYLPTDELIPSVTHVQAARRRRFNEQALQELAASIKQSGVLQPILVRPFHEPNIVNTANPGSPGYEIVAGERRFVATRLAGLTQIPAIVRDLTDAEVLEAQLVENVQRESLDPLSEAEGYRELMQLKHINADELAAIVGKSRSSVFARLKLLDLEPDGRAAVEAGKLDASRALLVARIRDPKMQATALELALETDYQDRPKYSYRFLLQELGRARATMPLSEATFSLDDATLSPGPCTTCEFRTGNCAVQGEDESPDVCTDVRCFKAKTRAADDRRLKAAKQAGLAVFAGEEAEKMAKSAAYGMGDMRRVRNLLGHVDLDSVCHDDEYPVPRPEETGNEKADEEAWDTWERGLDAHRRRTFRELLGEAAQPIAVYVDPKTKRVSELMSVPIVRELLKAKGIELSPAIGASETAGPRHTYDSEEWRQKQAAERAKLEKTVAFRMKIASAIFTASRSELDDSEITEVAKTIGDTWWARDVLPKIYGGKPVPGSMTHVDRCRYIRFALLARELTLDSARVRAPMLDALAKRFSVDVKAIKAEIEGKAPKASPKKKAKPAAKKTPAKKAKAK